MKCDRRNMPIFRGLHFEPDNEIGPKNSFEMAGGRQQSPTPKKHPINCYWNALWKEMMLESSGWDCCGYHWDRLSEARRFDRETQPAERLDIEKDVAGMKLSPRDRILEIGSGPGAYTIPLARRSLGVTAVEPGLGMGQVLLENATAVGLTNIDLVPKKWEEVDWDTDIEPPYDLVLAAFSLSMPDIRAAVAKMTAVSRKTVCLYWFAGDNTCDQRCRHLWPSLFHRPYAPEPKADLLLNVLFGMGIYPHVRVFPFHRKTVFRSTAEALEQYRSRFNLAPGRTVDQVLGAHLAKVLAPENGVLIRDCRATCVKIWWDISSQ